MRNAFYVLRHDGETGRITVCGAAFKNGDKAQAARQRYRAMLPAGSSTYYTVEVSPAGTRPTSADLWYAQAEGATLRRSLARSGEFAEVHDAAADRPGRIRRRRAERTAARRILALYPWEILTADPREVARIARDAEVGQVLADARRGAAVVVRQGAGRGQWTTAGYGYR